jgi:hypothetical protein
MTMKDEDEYRHPSPKPGSKRLWGDTLWVSTVDPVANIFGINHFHLTNQGFARFEALYIIDGVLQQYGNKCPLTPEADRGPWSDGVLTYEVVEPQEASLSDVRLLRSRSQSLCDIHGRSQRTGHALYR